MKIKRFNESIDEETKQEALRVLRRYHNSALRIDPEIGDIKELNIGGVIKEECLGFIFKGNKIFYHVGSDCVCVTKSDSPKDNDIRELSVGEIKNLS